MSDEPTERDVEALARELHATENPGATPGMTCSECRRTARIVAPRIAQARREGATDALLPFARWLLDRRGTTDLPERMVTEYRAALRGDA